MTHDEWKAEGERRFGPDPKAWRWVCPVCGHVAGIDDWTSAGAPETAIAFSCVGRWLPPGLARKAFGFGGRRVSETPSAPCNYAGGGFLRLNPVEVQMPDHTTLHAFAWAEAA